MKTKMRVFLVMTIMAVFCVISLFLGKQKVMNHTVVVPPKEPLPIKPEILMDTYFPIHKDTLWTYESPKGDTQISVDFLKEQVFQLRIKQGDETWVKVFVEEEDTLYEVATVADAFAKIDYTWLRQYKEIVLKFPLEIGDQWIVGDGSIKEILAVTEPIETALGQTRAMVLQVMSEDTSYLVYFGERLGIVKIIVNGLDDQYAITLRDIQLNTRIEEEIEVYSVNKETMQIEMHKQIVPIMTNEETMHFMTDVLKKTTDESYLPALPANVMITTIYQDQQTKKVHVVLNEEALQKGYDSSEEALATQCLVNTIATYYRVGDVGLTVEGSPYYTWIQKQ
ncbi:MAG: GerMN domain-containing protein [Cellulosilyticaceae bacterium]